MSDKVLSVTAVTGTSAKTQIEAGNFHLTIDEPLLFGGENTAPSPVEFLLASVAGCIGAIGKVAAKELGIEIELTSTVEGTIDADRFFGTSENVRAGFQSIRAFIEVRSDCSEMQLSEWKTRVEQRCPVIDNLLHITPLTVDVKKAD